MAATLHYFMLPDDERALFRHLERRELTVYPELVPPGYTAPRVAPDLVAELSGPAYYLALERLGPVIVHPVKRGRDKGMLEIEEVPSPVFHYERSLPNEEGELVAGRLWAELDVTDDANTRIGKPLALKTPLPGDPRLLPEELAPQRPEGLLGRPARRRRLEAGRAEAPGGRGTRVAWCGVWR